MLLTYRYTRESHNLTNMVTTRHVYQCHSTGWRWDSIRSKSQPHKNWLWCGYQVLRSHEQSFSLKFQIEFGNGGDETRLAPKVNRQKIDWAVIKYCAVTASPQEQVIIDRLCQKGVREGVGKEMIDDKQRVLRTPAVVSAAQLRNTLGESVGLYVCTIKASKALY